MSLGGETFDVIVVGVVDALRGSEGVVAADLAGVCKLPTANVKMALNHGELVVHRRVDGPRAKLALDQLRQLGAKVEARPSEDSIDMPVIEPDPEEVPELISARFDRRGPDIGAPTLDPGAPSIDSDLPRVPVPPSTGSRRSEAQPRAPIAPPPAFGSVPTAAVSEPPSPDPRTPEQPRVPHTGLVDPSRPQGNPALQPERPFGPVVDDARTRRFAPVSASASGIRRRGQAATEIRDIDAPTSKYEPVPQRPERGRAGGPSRTLGHASPAAPASRAPEPAEPSDPLDSLVGHLEAAASDAVSVGVVTLDGLAAEPEKKRTQASAASPIAASRDAFEPASAPALSLDTPGTPAAASGSRSIGLSPTPASTAAGVSPAASSFSGSYAGTSGSFAGASSFGLAPNLAEPEPRNLFVSDPVANYLIGVALGLVVAGVIAMATRSGPRDEIMGLEEELAQAYVRPLAAASGEIRPANEIEESLDDSYGRARRNFILTMLLVGVPLGLGAGRIRLGG